MSSTKKTDGPQRARVGPRQIQRRPYCVCGHWNTAHTDNACLLCGCEGFREPPPVTLATVHYWPLVSVRRRKRELDV